MFRKLGVSGGRGHSRKKSHGGQSQPQPQPRAGASQGARSPFGLALVDQVAPDAVSTNPPTDESYGLSPALIPAILRACRDFLAVGNNLESVGIFRISGNANAVNQVKAEMRLLDENPQQSEFGFVQGTDEATDVACLMKVWSRELPEPLVPYHLYPVFIATIGQAEWTEDDKVRALKRAAALMPPENFAALRFLTQFLKSVAAKSAVNMMASANLAICWAPNLLRSKDESLATIIGDAGRANGAIKLLFERCDDIFALGDFALEGNEKTAAEAAPPGMETAGDADAAAKGVGFVQDLDRSYERHKQDEEKKIQRERAQSVASPVLMAKYEESLAEQAAAFKAGVESPAQLAEVVGGSSGKSDDDAAATESTWEAAEYAKVKRMTIVMAKRGQIDTRLPSGRSADDLAALEAEEAAGAADEAGDDDDDFAKFEAEYKQRQLDEAAADADANANLAALGASQPALSVEHADIPSAPEIPSWPSTPEPERAAQPDDEKAVNERVRRAGSGRAGSGRSGRRRGVGSGGLTNMTGSQLASLYTK